MNKFTQREVFKCKSCRHGFGKKQVNRASRNKANIRFKELKKCTSIADMDDSDYLVEDETALERQCYPRLNFNVLDGFLNKNVGKPWSEVHQAMSRAADKRSFNGYMLWQEISWLTAPRHSRHWLSPYYVDEDGILRKTEIEVSKSSEAQYPTDEEVAKFVGTQPRTIPGSTYTYWWSPKNVLVNGTALYWVYAPHYAQRERLTDKEAAFYNSLSENAKQRITHNSKGF